MKTITLPLADVRALVQLGWELSRYVSETDQSATGSIYGVEYAQKTIAKVASALPAEACIEERTTESTPAERFANALHALIVMHIPLGLSCEEAAAIMAHAGELALDHLAWRPVETKLAHGALQKARVHLGGFLPAGLQPTEPQTPNAKP